MDIVLDVATNRAFEELPGQRYRALNVDIALIAPAADLETRSRDRYRIAILAPVDPLNPAGVMSLELGDGLLEFRFRDFRRLTVLDVDIQSRHRTLFLPAAAIETPYRGYSRKTGAAFVPRS